MDTFRPDRSLLNPKFEGYKLLPIDQENVVIRHELLYKPTQSTTSTRSPLSFHEVRSRITHNHLCISSEGRRALYVDADYNVVLVDVDLERLQPECRVVYELPQPIHTSSIEGSHPEYPSAAFLTPSIVFVSDGHGYMYIIYLPETEPARLLGQCKLSSSESSGLAPPFRIHEAVEVSPDLAVVLLSSLHYEGGPATGAQKNRSVQYDVWAVQFALPLVASLPQVTTDMAVFWRRRGEDVPVYTAYDEISKSFLLIGSSVYRAIDDPMPLHDEPSADELAPIPRADEALDVAEKVPQKPPPYSWTQTSDSVTVAFPLPSTTPKSDINVTFSAKAVTCHIRGVENNAIPVPHYSLKQLWDGISPSTSFWTWDREAEHSVGLLTFHLDKQHEGTKWVQLFADDDDVDVPETVDPSELWHIREALEKYTCSLRDGEDVSGLGLGKGVPSLAEGEMDDEVDSSVGRTVYLTWVGETASIRSTETPFTLLSTTLPGIPASPITLVVKNHIEGTVFALGRATGTEPLPWYHNATFSALAFVLASKQDTRFTYHIPSRAVLAFENGSRDRGGNVYIYSQSRTSEKWAKQIVLKINDGSSGSLLGVGALRSTQGKNTLLCLTEGSLVLVHNVV